MPCKQLLGRNLEMILQGLPWLLKVESMTKLGKSSPIPNTLLVACSPVFKIEVLIWVSFWRALKFQPFRWRVGSNLRRQSKNIENEIQNSYQTCARIIWYIFSIQCEELRINQLTPLLVVTIPYTCWFLWRVDYIENFKWRLHFQFGVVFWRAILRAVYLERPNCVEGHWRLQSWILMLARLWLSPNCRSRPWVAMSLRFAPSHHRKAYRWHKIVYLAQRELQLGPQQMN